MANAASPMSTHKRPQRLGLQPDRPLDPGGLHLLHVRDVDAAQARGAPLPQERLAVCGAVAEPDQQRRIAPAMAGCRSTGRTRASRTTLPKADEAPTAGNCPGEATIPTMRTAASLGRLASGLADDEPDDAAHPQALTVGGGKSIIASPGARRFTIRPEMTLNRLSRKPRPPPQVGDGHQLRQLSATRPDGKMADDAATSIRAHCATSGSASIFASARPDRSSPRTRR